MLKFLDMVSVAPDLRIEELVVGARSAWRRTRCATAVRQPSEETLVPAKADTVLSAGDLLIVVGPARVLGKLADHAA